MSDNQHYTIGDGLTKLCEENGQLKAQVAELERGNAKIFSRHEKLCLAIDEKNDLIKELERERDELKNALFHKNEVIEDMEKLKGELAKRDFEQHEAGFELGYWFARKTYAECMKRTHSGEWEADKAILNDKLNELRKGAGDDN